MMSFLLVSYQGYSQKGYGFGINGSINTVWITNQNMYGDAEINHAVKVAPEFNLTGGYNFIDNLGLWIDLGYAKLGQNYSGTQGTSNTVRDINLNYFNIPILVKVVAGGESKFHLLIGPKFAFLMSANQTYTRDGAPYTDYIYNLSGVKFNKGATDITDRYVGSDIFLMMDLGADIYVSENLYLNVGLTLNYGLKVIDAPDYRIDNVHGTYDNNHNAVIGLNIGLNYMFKDKK